MTAQTEAEIAICGKESQMSPGKFCRRPVHPDTALHIYGGLPHEGGSSLDQKVTAAEKDGFVSLLLPTDDLRALQEAWERLDDDQMRTEAVKFLRDVFQGQDGHLYALDQVLGCPSES
jgi:hypothetical protein